MRRPIHLFSFVFIVSIIASLTFLSSCDTVEEPPKDELEKAQLIIPNNKIDVLKEGNPELSLSMSVNYGWKAESDIKWCVVSLAEGSSKDNFTIEVKENDTNFERVAIVTINSAHITQKVSITQKRGENFVDTKNPSNLQAKIATFNGALSTEITEPMTELGFAYSTSSPVSLENGTKIASGVITGAFTCDVTVLTALTKYYVRAYATDGTKIYYGVTKSFTTTDNLAVLAVPAQAADHKIIIYDRNVGEDVPLGGVSHSYTNNVNQPNNAYPLFRGGYFTAIDAQTACPTGWRLPNTNEIKAISDALEFEASSEYSLEGTNGAKCYFPMSGHGGAQTNAIGYYWSSAVWSTSANRMELKTNLNRVSSAALTLQFSVRCVRTYEE